jgi:hypothetical protein
MGWSLRAVKALAITFGENAVLWMGKDAVPRLGKFSKRKRPAG